MYEMKLTPPGHRDAQSIKIDDRYDHFNLSAGAYNVVVLWPFKDILILANTDCSVWML